MKCRFCGNKLSHEFIDLGNAPPSNSFLTEEQLSEPEVFYPLRVFVCEKCFLVQIGESRKSDEIFNKDYAYFSSYSKTWLDHAKKYVDMITERLGLNTASHVIEIASNDGYLLQYFQEKRIPCLGIEPTDNTACVARKKGIAVVIDFFGLRLARELASEGRKADLIVGNNVLAHVPDINDFVCGLKILLQEKGVITMEFPYLMKLVENSQFDTIYHEHFSYFSLFTVQRIFASHNLVLFDVEELPTHGGSLRIYAKHLEDTSHNVSENIDRVLNREADVGMRELRFYRNFQKQANQVKHELLAFLLEQKRLGKKVVAYGAAAKGNTLLNYCGVKKDLIGFVVDASPHKKGKFLPGNHIPVVAEREIKKVKPDYVLILAWNIKHEITYQLGYIKDWVGKFLIAIPKVQVF